MCTDKPVDVSALYPLGTRKQVQAALLELYHGRQIYCCLYQRGGTETSVWWQVGGAPVPYKFGLTGRSAAA